MTPVSDFNPNDHMITLQGKSYLPVAARIIWLRTVHPDAIITTEIVEHNAADKWVIIKATVALPSTGAMAHGMARQEPTRIAVDYIANGETSAVGRAIGMLGFGTLAADFDQGEQVVDSPVERRAAPAPPTDPELEAARAALKAARTTHDWSLQRIVETASWVWPHITSAADLGTLTPVQLARLTEVVTGESIIHLDTHGARRIMPAEVLGAAS